MQVTAVCCRLSRVHRVSGDGDRENGISMRQRGVQTARNELFKGLLYSTAHRTLCCITQNSARITANSGIGRESLVLAKIGPRTSRAVGAGATGDEAANEQQTAAPRG